MADDDDFVQTVDRAVAAMDKAIARIDRLESALRQIATLEIDIGFMMDHLVWAKGLAREALEGRDVFVWRDISLAPKTGVAVDLWVTFIQNNHLRFTNCVWRLFSEDDGHWYCQDRFIALLPEHGYTVTHFMPMPGGPDT